MRGQSFFLCVCERESMRVCEVEIGVCPRLSCSRKLSTRAQMSGGCNDIRLTVRELVRLGTVNATNMFSFFDAQREERVQNAINLVGLVGVENKDVSKLSGGQRQRAVIARALASDAEFILLDEPLVGIDRNARNSLLKLLDQLCHNQGKTILMVSHDLAAIRQTAHRMIYLEETIRYDGDTAHFPGLTELAALRGIQPVHGHDHAHHHSHSHHEHASKEDE